MTIRSQKAKHQKREWYVEILGAKKRRGFGGREFGRLPKSRDAAVAVIFARILIERLTELVVIRPNRECLPAILGQHIGLMLRLEDAGFVPRSVLGPWRDAYHHLRNAGVAAAHEGIPAPPMGEALHDLRAVIGTLLGSGVETP